MEKSGPPPEVLALVTKATKIKKTVEEGQPPPGYLGNINEVGVATSAPNGKKTEQTTEKPENPKNPKNQPAYLEYVEYRQLANLDNDRTVLKRQKAKKSQRPTPKQTNITISVCELDSWFEWHNLPVLARKMEDWFLAHNMKKHMTYTELYNILDGSNDTDIYKDIILYFQ